MKVVMLLSGGVDSTVLYYWALKKGLEVYSLFVDYGQRNKREREYAEYTSQRSKLHKTIEVQIPREGALNHGEIPLLNCTGGRSPAYLPARNLIFLSLAASYAESYACNHIAIGANGDDQAGFPDCRKDFFEAFSNVSGIPIWAPLIRSSKLEIIQKGLELGVDFSHTTSCYSPQDGQDCQTCDACLLRVEALKCIK